MIYRVEDGELSVVCLEVEYDRDLSSQLAGKSEWTATEDCWFQFNSVIYAKNNNQTNTNLVIQLNGITVSNTDSIADAADGVLTMVNASVFMKKGDKIFYFNSETGTKATFGQGRYVKIFPLTMKERK